MTQVPTEEPECEGRGGAILEEKGKPTSATEICTGEEGSPWTDGGVLPGGATLTGTWSFNASSENDEIFAPISFPIPLEDEEGLPKAQVHFQPEFSEPTELAEFEALCPGFVTLPGADPGHLCVFSNRDFEGEALFNATLVDIVDPLGIFGGEERVSRVGGMLHFEFTGSAGEPAHGFGTWAVTGCTKKVGKPFQCPTP